MTGKKEEKKEKIHFIKWFSELNKDSGPIAGGKGANLGEIYDLDVPVPPGFVVTAQAYDYFIEKADVDDKIKELLSNFDYEDTKDLNLTPQYISQFVPIASGSSTFGTASTETQMISAGPPHVKNAVL